MFNTSQLYYENYYCPTKVAINQGGTSSGKTYTILQVLFTLAIKDAGCVITVVGQDIPNLKKGALRDAQTIVAKSPILQSFIKSYNKSDRIYEFKNGSIMEFTSFSDEQDAKSGKRDYLFVNEANGIEYLIYWQLSIRTKKKVFVDYNPTAKFWAHEKLIGTKDCTLFISDHRHNPFLEQSLHDEIEAIEDPELRKVYARGLTGKITGLIWPHYKFCDDIPEFLLDESCYGLDIGFNHPTALIETVEWSEQKALYWDEVIYESHLTTDDLIERFKLEGVSKSKTMYVDSARPDVIESLQQAGYNALPAEKDVLEGIRYVKYRKLYITRRSKNLKKELNAYKWKEDKKTGESLDEPVKFKDDACDAGRYGSYSNRNSQGGNLSISNSPGTSSMDDRLNDFLNFLD